MEDNNSTKDILYSMGNYSRVELLLSMMRETFDLLADF